LVEAWHPAPLRHGLLKHGLKVWQSRAGAGVGGACAGDEAGAAVEAWIIGAGVDVGLTEGAGVELRANALSGVADYLTGGAIQARVVQAGVD